MSGWSDRAGIGGSAAGDGSAPSELPCRCFAGWRYGAHSIRKNETEVLPMASTTKIMTCILALENAGPDTEVLISDRAASMPEVKLHVRKGERYCLRDLLYSMMLESHNDSAAAIAEAVGGSVENFADMMNRKAVELGCEDTYFLTPNGLDAKERKSGKIHSTTAADLARILRYGSCFLRQRRNFLPSQEHRPIRFQISPAIEAFPV